MATNPDNEHRSLHPPSFQHFRALINRQGRLNVHGTRERRKIFSDLYHYFFSLSWPHFFIRIAAIYLMANLFFAVLYFISGVDALGGDGHSTALERFKHCFFLSV